MRTRWIVTRPVTIGELCELMGFPREAVEAFLTISGIEPACCVGRSRTRIYNPEQVAELMGIADEARLATA